MNKTIKKAIVLGIGILAGGLLQEAGALAQSQSVIDPPSQGSETRLQNDSQDLLPGQIVPDDSSIEPNPFAPPQFPYEPLEGPAIEAPTPDGIDFGPIIEAPPMDFETAPAPNFDGAESGLSPRNVRPRSFGGNSRDFNLKPRSTQQYPQPRRRSFGIAGEMVDGWGFKISRVSPGSIAAGMNLETGDVILNVNGRNVDCLETLQRELLRSRNRTDGLGLIRIDNVRARQKKIYKVVQASQNTTSCQGSSCSSSCASTPRATYVTRLANPEAKRFQWLRFQF